MPAEQADIRNQIQESIRINQSIAETLVEEILEVGEKLREVLDSGGTIYLCGNGGSAADAQHVAAELVGRFQRERAPIAATALTTNTSILTAVGNDYGFAEVFERQVRAVMKPQDALAALSTSGKSQNVLNAVRAAREVGGLTVAFTGTPGEPLASEVDLSVRIPSEKTTRIQEAHILVWHLLCDHLEKSRA